MSQRMEKMECLICRKEINRIDISDFHGPMRYTNYNELYNTQNNNKCSCNYYYLLLLLIVLSTSVIIFLLYMLDII